MAFPPIIIVVYTHALLAIGDCVVRTITYSVYTSWLLSDEREKQRTMEEEEADGRILMDGQDSSNIQATHSKNETEACSVHPSTKNHDAHKTMTMGATTQQQTASRNINTASGDGKTESSTESMRISSSAPTVESKPLHLNARNANDSPRDTELLSKQGQEKSGSQDRKKTPDPKRPHDFLYGKELGAGAYARVLHCRDRRTHADYACKIIDRRFIIKEKKVSARGRRKWTLMKMILQDANAGTIRYDGKGCYVPGPPSQYCSSSLHF